jgi:xanthine dehydrogenase accessory factor
MASAYFSRTPVLVRGGGDLASGVIYRLHRAGFPVAVTELAAPVFVRRAVSFGEAIYSGSINIEGVVARRTEGIGDVQKYWDDGIIPVLVDPDGVCIRELRPVVIVDARMAKTNSGTTIHDAPVVIGLGPGFRAGVDCQAVVETNRGHDLGRVIREGSAEADTGEPGVIEGKSHSRVLRSPTNGYVQTRVAIGDWVEAGQVVATVDNQSIVALFAGVVRGMIHEQVQVTTGMKIGDLDPRANKEACFTISDKSLAVGGGVVEAVLSAPQVRAYLEQFNNEAAKSL